MADIEVTEAGSSAGAGLAARANGNDGQAAGANGNDGLAAGANGNDGQAAVAVAVATAEAGPDGADGLAAAASSPGQTAAPASPGQTAAPASPGAGPARSGRPWPPLRVAGVCLLLLAIFVLGFAAYLYGLSGVQEARTQSILYTRLQAELAGVQGQAAPLGPVTSGTPVAVLDIPGAGIHDTVVVEGTSPENLTAGPGHLRDTPMPGQPGVAEIFGRRATFGGPFANIGALRPGDTIKAITGQGTFTYTVAAVATDNTKIIEDPAPNRLLLLTASSATIPSYYTEVDADLTSSVQPSPGVVNAIYPQELPLAGDKGALTLTMEWSMALVLVAAGGTIAAIRWSPWAAYLAAVPVALAVLWNLYQNLAALLPNLY
jgi:sortase A